MEVTKYPITDTVTQTTFHGLQKIEASNGEIVFVARDGTIYQTLREYIERQIKHYSFWVGTYKRNCDGLRYNQWQLDSWTRILNQE